MFTAKSLSDKHNFDIQFGNYNFYQVLKCGKLTTVYLGEHRYFANKVVAKVLNTWVATDAHVESFYDEARLHAGLRHPNIVRVLDFGMQGRIPFMIMDYATGGTLQDYCVPGMPLPLATIMPFILQIAAALQYIHQHNLIHRDIKPQNIFLNAENEVWLSDFGISIAIQPWSRRRLHASVGTALYAAPEQIDGRPLTASDQYALAVLIYTLLCGVPPFSGTSMQLCEQHMYALPPALRSYTPTLPDDVEGVVLKALSKDPYERFPSTQDFACALQAAAHEYGPETEPALPVAITDQLAPLHIHS